MNTVGTKGITNNRRKKRQFYRLICRTLRRLLTKGFYGEVSFHTSIEDGAIQDFKKQETQKFRMP